jgi:glycosyltransferase involved in cell wall biosynthesis
VVKLEGYKIMGKLMVSINCTTYNHEDYIIDAIEGFLMQKTNFEFEILIHDDASTDNTPKIIRKYELRYPNLIKPIYQTENQFSKGIKVTEINSKRANGKYIAICEGDDYWTDPYKLQKQVDYMEKNRDCTLCVHAVEKVRTDKVNIGYERPYNKSSISPAKDFILGGGYFVGTASLLYPKILMEDPPKFFLNSPVRDYPLQIILASKGNVYYMDEVMAAYRVGVVGSWSQKQISGKDIRIKQLDYAQRFIQMLNAFDVYTDYRFSYHVNKKIIYYRFKMALLNREIKYIKSNDFYKKLNVKKKFAIHLKILFPGYYQELFKEYIDHLLNEANV